METHAQANQSKHDHLVQSPKTEHDRLLAAGGFRQVFRSGMVEDGDALLSLHTSYSFVFAMPICVYLSWNMTRDAADQEMATDAEYQTR